VSPLECLAWLGVVVLAVVVLGAIAFVLAAAVAAVRDDFRGDR
jgi:hypothetical protein